MRRGSRLVPLIVTIVVTLAGCGDQQGSLPSTTSPVGSTGSTSGAIAEERTTTIPAAGGVAAEACWSGDQRMTATTGGSTMATTQYKQAPAMAIDPKKTYAASLETSKGTIEAEFFPEDAPATVNNFICLARDGYYDGTPFHRILSGFVIQGGDPTGTGAGGPGYQFADEPVKREYQRGVLAMANAGPNTNGSQFFIVLGDLRTKLPKNYTIFGQVTGGLDVVDAIAATPVRPGPGGERSQPTEAVTVTKVSVSEK